MLSEIQKRFSEIDKELLDGIMACCPTSDKFFSEPHLTALALHYHIELKSEEVVIARNYLRRRREGCGAVENMQAVYNLLDADKFPSLRATIQADHTGQQLQLRKVLQYFKASPYLAQKDLGAKDTLSPGSDVC